MSEDIKISQFAKDYFSKLKTDFDNFDFKALEIATRLIWQTYSADKTLFFIGNGGSAATASHMANGFAKGVAGYKGEKSWRRFRAVSLTESVATFTAWANDVSYEDIFSEQLKNLGQKGDLLVAIAASGNSPNIVKACQTAKELGLKVLGFVGFNGGKLAKLADIAIVVKDNDYGRVEDVHLLIHHVITEYFFEFLSRKYSK